MITKSTMYAVTEDRKIIFKGSKSAARKIWKAKKKEHADKLSTYITLWNSPGSKVGDTIG